MADSCCQDSASTAIRFHSCIFFFSVKFLPWMSFFYLDNKSIRYVIKMGYCHEIGGGYQGRETELVSGLAGRRLLKY